MTVRQIHGFSDGTLRAFLDWDATPGVRYKLELTSDGRIVEWSARDERGLSSRRLRQAPIGRMERFVRQHMAESADRTSRADGATDTEPPPPFGHEYYALKLAEFFRDWAAGRRPADTVLAVAVAYADAVLGDGEERPVVAVAAQLHLSETTVRNYLYKARMLGLLTSLGKGKAGGELTDKAREILDGK